jgi:hypothetical protein
LEKLKSRTKIVKEKLIEAITLINKLRAMTLRSDNSFYLLRAITNINNKAKALYDNTKT